MAQNKKKVSLIDKIYLGSEKSEGYARDTLPSNRWELFWDIVKGSFGKLIIVNLLTLLFFLPLFALLFFRYIALSNAGAAYQFMQSFGVGYQAPFTMAGLSENILLSINGIMYLFMPIALMIAAVGVSGGAYIIRNMVWTEGIFVANDFWSGIKKNIGQIILTAVIYSFIFYILVMVASLCSQAQVTAGDSAWLFVVAEILTYILLAFISMVVMHMITMSVTYELKYFALIKNAMLFTIGLLPQNIFFIALCSLPIVIFMLGGIFTGMGIIIILLFGLSWILLIWTNYCQWGYDNFINDKIKAKKNRGIYKKTDKKEDTAIQKYKDQMNTPIRTSLNSKPIKPITDDELQLVELPTSFSREDIIKLNESKQAIYDDHARYVEEHKNDEQFKPTIDEQKALENQKEREKRIEKAKKELAKRNKK